VFAVELICQLLGVKNSVSNCMTRSRESQKRFVVQSTLVLYCSENRVIVDSGIALKLIWTACTISAANIRSRHVACYSMFDEVRSSGAKRCSLRRTEKFVCAAHVWT
jgi:hypothetical protein